MTAVQWGILAAGILCLLIMVGIRRFDLHQRDLWLRQHGWRVVTPATLFRRAELRRATPLERAQDEMWRVTFPEMPGAGLRDRPLTATEVRRSVALHLARPTPELDAARDAALEPIVSRIRRVVEDHPLPTLHPED